MSITLRKIEPTDLPYLYQWENDSSTMCIGSVYNPLSQSDLRQYIDNTTGDAFRDGQLRLIIMKDGNETIGCVDIYDLDVRNRKAAIGIYIAPLYRQQGAAAKAIQEVENIGFKQLGLRMLYAVVQTNNHISEQLFSSLGYTADGLLKDWTLESDVRIWQKRNIYL